MNKLAIVFAVLFGVSSGVAHASTSTDIYSESITRQLSSAEIPKSFESSARNSGALADNHVTAPADTMIEPVAIESVDQLDTASVQKKSKKRSSH